MYFFFSSRRRHTRCLSDWSSDVCSSDLSNMLPVWNWDTVNFWSQIAFAFSGLELVSAMSQEVRDPQKTLRSEERRVGKECRCRGEKEREKKKEHEERETRR